MYQWICFSPNPDTGPYLPLYNPSQDHGTGEVESTLRPSIGGMYDFAGARQRLPRRQVINVRGFYWGHTRPDLVQTALIVPPAPIVDGSGHIISYTVPEAAETRIEVHAMKAKVGVYDKLWRANLDDGQLVYQWARLMQVRIRQEKEHRTRLAEVNCTFESYDMTLHSDATHVYFDWRVLYGTVKK